MTAIPIFDGVRAIASRYPVWLCDIWGVLHNGEAAYPAATDALLQFRESGGTVILITNAPRPHGDIARQIAGLGINAAAYDAIVTSGDVTRKLIAAYAGRKIFHLGPEKDHTLFAGIGITLAPVQTAEAVICTGLIDDLSETPTDYIGQLASFNARNLPMICANPDIVVERGSQICYCAGALGQAYEALGGAVAYAGKPKAPIYQEAMARAARLRGGTIAKREALAIGDGLRTDILGAHDFGLDALFVASGIHLNANIGLDAGSLAGLFAGAKARPIAAVERLAW